MAAPMRKPLMRIPYTEVFASPRIIPASAKSLPHAMEALAEFITASSPARGGSSSTVCLSGAGLSVASGLADYRGDKGTYRLNKSYRPIYHHEFLASHAARRRYWARSFLGWSTLRKARPNAAHRAVDDLARLGLVSSVITQNVDGLHHHAAVDGHGGGGAVGAGQGIIGADLGVVGEPPLASSQTGATPMNIVELHGYLRALVCTSCYNEYPRDAFQDDLARLNPAWAAFLAETLATGALDTENPAERNAKGIRSNPDGDVDLPGAPYTTFRYPACPKCLADPPPPSLRSVVFPRVDVDADGAWLPTSTAGVLKPAVVMFGESIPEGVKLAAERAVAGAGRLMVLGTSLATYSAWRLVKLAKDRGMPIAIVNMGGVRGEEAFFEDLVRDDEVSSGREGVRIEMSTEVVLPALVEALVGRTSSSKYPLARRGEGLLVPTTAARSDGGRAGGGDRFKDMLS